MPARSSPASPGSTCSSKCSCCCKSRSSAGKLSRSCAVYSASAATFPLRSKLSTARRNPFIIALTCSTPPPSSSSSSLPDSSSSFTFTFASSSTLVVVVALNASLFSSPRQTRRWRRPSSTKSPWCCCSSNCSSSSSSSFSQSSLLSSSVEGMMTVPRTDEFCAVLDASERLVVSLFTFLHTHSNIKMIKMKLLLLLQSGAQPIHAVPQAVAGNRGGFEYRPRSGFNVVQIQTFADFGFGQGAG